MKRIVCLILVITLLVCAGSALAATTAGSSSDPLISLSYVTGTYVPGVTGEIKTLITAGETAVKNHLSSALSELEGEYGADVNYLTGYKALTAASGDSFTLPFGSSLILLEGTMRVTHSGAVLCASEGAEAASGSELTKNARYLVMEDTSAVFTVTSATASLMIEGAHTGDGTVVVTFTDVPYGHYAYEAICSLAGAGLVSGIGDGSFRPGDDMTRGMFVTLLGRVYGVNTASYTSVSFTDVKSGAYYAPYVEWASKNGLVSGMGDGTFAPDSPITRQQMAKLVVAFADFAGYPLGSASAQTVFSDDAQIASWAKAEVYRAQRAGLINGIGGAFKPGDTATRAQVCTIVYRLTGNR